MWRTINDLDLDADRRAAPLHANPRSVVDSCVEYGCAQLILLQKRRTRSLDRLAFMWSAPGHYKS
ncbi:hypothetical protein Plhal304r1_c032g0102761 [Plasmopara halstedii]